ncbi:MAG: sugar nucleotide-binding protein, partial [Lentisphaeria bacterium]
MKIVITGASGLLGREIYKILKQKFNAIGTAFSRTNQDLVKLDLTDPIAVTAFLKNERPDVVVHAAAERKPDICDKTPEIANLINISATETLTALSKELQFHLIHISTD